MKSRILAGLFLLYFSHSISAAWDQYRGNAERTGYNSTDYLAVSSCSKSWEENISEGGINLSSPAMDSNYIYVGAINGGLYKINKGNGAVAGTYHASGSINAPPLIHSGNIFFGSSDGHFYAIDSTMSEIWQPVTATAGISSSPAYIIDGANEYVLFLDDNGSIFLINSGSGAVVSGYPVKASEYFSSSPSILDQNAVMVSSAGNIFSLLNSNMFSSPVISLSYKNNDNVFCDLTGNTTQVLILGHSGALKLLNLANWSVLEERELTGKTGTDPVFDSNNNSFTVSISDNGNARLYLLSGIDLTGSTINSSGDYQRGAGAASSANIISVADTGNISFYDIHGNTAGTISSGAGILNSAALDGGLVLFDADGNVKMYSNSTILTPNL